VAISIISGNENSIICELLSARNEPQGCVFSSEVQRRQKVEATLAPAR
jgi:hypothetical protein